MKKYALIPLVLGVAALVCGALLYSSQGKVDTSDPMFYVITLGIVLVITSAAMFTARSREKSAQKQENVRLLAMTAMFAALSFVGFYVFRIDIPIGGEGKTAIHLGNAFLVLSALFLGGSRGGISGAVGLTLADLLSGYVSSMPKTFLIKFVIGWIAGTLADRAFRLKEETDRARRVKKSCAAAGIALAFNVAADPMLGYLYKRYLYGIPQDAAALLAKAASLATLVNAAISFAVVVLVYNLLRPALEKNHLV